MVRWIIRTVSVVIPQPLLYSVRVCSKTVRLTPLQVLLPAARCSTPRPGPFLNTLRRLYETRKRLSQVVQHRYQLLQSINRCKSPISPEIWFIRPARQPNGPQPTLNAPNLHCQNPQNCLSLDCVIDPLQLVPLFAALPCSAPSKSSEAYPGQS